MPLAPAYLPFSSPYDPAEDPPGSIDPLGTLSLAERLADALLPGFTVRMWRARLLTYSGVASLVSSRVVERTGREDFRLEARLAFERLYVSAVVRAAEREGDAAAGVRRRLPGVDLARTALCQEDRPLGRGSFLKGQAVNGPFGVMARLARNRRVLDPEDFLGSEGESLLLVWGNDNGLSGVLDDARDGNGGCKWLTDVVRSVTAHAAEKEWPPPRHATWSLLSDALRPDLTGPAERSRLVNIIAGDPVSARVIEVLRGGAGPYRRLAESDGRGAAERHVLREVVRPALGQDEGDTRLRKLLEAIDAYETLTALMQEGFDALRWSLTRQGGRAPKDKVVEAVGGLLRQLAAGLGRSIGVLAKATRQLEADAASSSEFAEGADDLLARLAGAHSSPAELAAALMTRHLEVQERKGKAAWIDADAQWTLMPGFGLDVDAAPRYRRQYLHPFRLANLYSVLADLGRVRFEDPDAAE